MLEPNERMAAYRRADRILVAEEVAVMPVGYVQSRLLVQPWIRLPAMSAGRLQLKEVTIT
ncbi:MAG: hypothetical protein ACK2TX_07280, partial [Anaerolineales bacterium]